MRHLLQRCQTFRGLPSDQCRDHVPNGLRLQGEVDLTGVHTRSCPSRAALAATHQDSQRSALRLPAFPFSVSCLMFSHQGTTDLIGSLGGRLSENGSHLHIFKLSPVASVVFLPCARRDLVLAQSWFQRCPSARRATDSALLVRQALTSVLLV